MKKSDIREEIGKSLYALLQKHGKTNRHKDYVAYVCFCILGSGLLNRLGPEEFKRMIKEIKSKNMSPS